MSSSPIFIGEKTSLASFPYFYNFNLKLALPIFIDENTKHFLHLIGRKIASYLFSLYLGTNLLHFSIKIPITHMKSLHFRFFCLIGRKITSYLLY